MLLHLLTFPRTRMAFHVALALPLLSLPLADSAFAVTTYDGTYQIDVTTDEGACAHSLSGTVTVSDGLIVATSESGATANGRVGADGVVSFAIHRGSDVAHISGRLKGARGQGAWSAPIQQCGGRWQATKIH